MNFALCGESMDKLDKEHRNRLEAIRKLWDDAAHSFDNETDHGLRDPVVHAAWTTLLSQLLPTPPSVVLDIGCGTGSLSVVLAKLNHNVTGVDLSPAMIEIASKKAKRAGHSITFQIMDAAFPQLPSQQFDAIVCRHLLWALPDPKQVLLRWANLLKSGGSLILIEGFWHTDGGLHAQDIISMMPSSMTDVSVRNLSKETVLWGSEVTDERYVIRSILSR
jgi:2-polyprenyl-3-methyl-5-hydroxy-6-metoxy-1,4-benzoquinol methylase